MFLAIVRKDLKNVSKNLSNIYDGYIISFRQDELNINDHGYEI